MPLFQRQIAVTVDTVRVTDLDMSFNVTRSLSREPNTAELNIWNLRESTRQTIQSKSRVRVKIEAGYAEQQLTSIFDGFVEDVHTLRDGPDNVTTIRTSDGGRKQRRARTNRSFGRGARVERVLRRLARDLDVGQGNINEAVANGSFEGLGREWANGTVVSGNAAEELSRILTSAGFDWSIQDGNLQILARQAAVQGTAVLLTPDTGLVETPTVDPDGIVTAKMLLIPDVFPGRKLNIISREFDGIFRAKKCEYIGDTAGNEWFIEVEAEELRGG
jgi:hypothetical protein